MQGFSGGLTNLIILQIHPVLQLSVTFTSHCSLKTGTTDPNECQSLRNRTTPQYCGTAAAVHQKSTLMKYSHYDMPNICVGKS